MHVTMYTFFALHQVYNKFHTLYIPNIDICNAYGSGETFDEAMDDLVKYTGSEMYQMSMRCMPIPPSLSYDEVHREGVRDEKRENDMTSWDVVTVHINTCNIRQV